MEFDLKIYFLILCGISAVVSFSWSNCGDSTEPIKVISLDVYSNQTKILYVTGRGKLAKNMTSPIKGQVEMSKKFFWHWLKIPCMHNMGSCTYDDICALSPFKSNKTCPSEFVKNDLPCKCPILQGQYAAKRFPINLNKVPNWIEEGTYRIKFTLSKDDVQLMCLLMNITF